MQFGEKIESFVFDWGYWCLILVGFEGHCCCV